MCVPCESLGGAVRARERERVALGIKGRAGSYESAAADGGVCVHVVGRVGSRLAKGKGGSLTRGILNYLCLQ